MAVLRQKTVGSGRDKQTIELAKLRNQFPDMSNNKFMYVVRDQDTKDRFEDPVFTKKEGRRLFNEVARQIKRGMEEKRSNTTTDFSLGGDSSSTDDLGIADPTEPVLDSDDLMF